MKKYISIFIITVCMAPAYSQVGVHLSWNNSVKNPTASSMSVTWSDRDPVEGIVMYGTDKDLKKSESALREYLSLVYGVIPRTMNSRPVLKNQMSLFNKCENTT